MNQMEQLKKEFLPKYLEEGETRFYSSLMLYAMNKMILLQKGIYKGESPEIDLMDYHDDFLTLFRREGDQTYLKLAKVFRRAAHHIYRTLLKKELTTKNSRFLNMVG